MATSGCGQLRLATSGLQWASSGLEPLEVSSNGLVDSSTREWPGVALNGLEWWVVVSAPEWLGYSLSGVERHRMVLRTVRAFMGFEWRRVAYAVGRDALGPDTLVMTRVMTT